MLTMSRPSIATALVLVIAASEVTNSLISAFYLAPIGAEHIFTALRHTPPLDVGTAKHSPAGDCGSHRHRALSERNATSDIELHGFW